AINPGLLGHGIYTQFSVRNALDHFAALGGGAPVTTPTDKIKCFVSAMQSMAVKSVWIQLFSRGEAFDNDSAGSDIRQNLIEALGDVGIHWAGWGYTSGKSWSDDQKIIDGLTKPPLHLSAFVIDAEPGNLIYPDPADPKNPDKKKPDLWDSDDFDAFTKFAH